MPLQLRPKMDVPARVHLQLNNRHLLAQLFFIQTQQKESLPSQFAISSAGLQNITFTRLPDNYF
jgi:hypothetical protein